MKIFLYKTAAAVMLLALCPLRALCQEHPASWEFGIGGSLMNLTRTSVTDFHQTAGGDYLFTLEERLLYGGADMYAAKELRKWLYADLQGTFGLARYYQSESLVRGWSAMAGPGLQFRPFTSSEWIQPFFRVGINWYRKTFPNSYFGQFQGDVTKEAVWKAEDAWNKGFTFDTDSFFSIRRYRYTDIQRCELRPGFRRHHIQAGRKRQETRVCQGLSGLDDSRSG